MTGGIEELDTIEPLPARLARHNFDRLIMLADGVFAIAVTLSALEIRLAPREGESWGDLAARLERPLAIYGLSFLVASLYWIGHRRTMARVGRTDALFTGLSLLFLACVALIPAATQLLIAERGATPAVAYLGLIAVLAGVQGVLWGYAAFVGRLVLPEVSRRYRWAHLIATLLTPLVSSTLTLSAVSLAGPWRWAASLAVVALVVWLRRGVLARWAPD